MKPYQGVELELYTEAMRTVPAVASARVRDAEDDSRMLVQTYMDRADELEIPRSSAWAILYSAAQVHIVGLIDLVADVQDTDPAEVCERMIQATVEQVASGAL